MADTSGTAMVLPKLPAAVKDFIPYFVKNANLSPSELLKPFKAYENQLRKIYAQQPAHEATQDGLANMVPVFDGHESSLKIRARDLSRESTDDKEKYIMALSDEDRKPDGAPAIVESLKDFRHNFTLFSESSLSDLDWKNVVVAGSAVTTSLLPVPEKWRGSKKKLRQYYHEVIAPASDVDLFIYGLDEVEGLAKLCSIEKQIKDSLLHETTTIRTKNAVTIASQHPTRHVQIVLRLYDSVSQIITGFDVDCACAAFDGGQVYASPRALVAFATQTNSIDLTRRSPSYEKRLSKYSHRGFEVHWPELDRARVDPTIFERSFRGTLGLARLLVLERLPKAHDRDSYVDLRRKERGRPAILRSWRANRSLQGNIKDVQEDEIAEWDDEPEGMSDYHTMVVPYGPKYTIAKINRMLYAKDLLLNAEWNRDKKREVNLHRHPCFFGSMEEVIEDCCGFCPVPMTEEEIEIAERESQIHISGRLTFIRDDPGRQEIGSFNPITTDDWTEMAYIGNTQMLCQAIADGDVHYVEAWCREDGNDVNTRDYVGRTPLHLAVTSSTLEVVKCLVDNGARLISRLVDGRTSLHLAAQLGRTEIIKVVMAKSLENEEIEDSIRANQKVQAVHSDDSSAEVSLEETDTTEADSMTIGSFVKIEGQKDINEQADEMPKDNILDPDVFDINVLAWDAPASPLHLAILGGHMDTVKMLVEDYGADVLLPVKLFDAQGHPMAALLTLVLTLALPLPTAQSIMKALLDLGATSGQGDMNQMTAVHLTALKSPSLLDGLLEHDRAVAEKMLNTVSTNGRNEAGTVLSLVLRNNDEKMASRLIRLGVKPDIRFGDFVHRYLARTPFARNRSTEETQKSFREICAQPVVLAAQQGMVPVVEALLDAGADASALDSTGYKILDKHFTAQWNMGSTLLDIVCAKIESLRNYDAGEPKPGFLPDLTAETEYVAQLDQSSYRYFVCQARLETRKVHQADAEDAHAQRLQEFSPGKPARDAKQIVIDQTIMRLESLRRRLLNAGVTTFAEKYPGQGMAREVPKVPVLQDQHVPISISYEESFSYDVPDLNDRTIEGYQKLFEAVWNNDTETVRTLTLGAWKSDDGHENLPLRIAVCQYDKLRMAEQPKTRKDSCDTTFSPYAIAILRGHYTLAKSILSIAQAQYHPPDDDDKTEKWRMKNADEEEDDDGDEDEDEGAEGDDEGEDERGGGVRDLVSEVVDDTFIIDNVAAVSNLVKSETTPLEMIGWQYRTDWFVQKYIPTPERTGLGRWSSNVWTLLEHAVEHNELSSLKAVLEMATALSMTGDDPSVYKLSDQSFNAAIRLGRVSALAELIKYTGVGVSFEHLVNDNVDERKSTTKYYQGLSIGGKKRVDWAQAGRLNRNVYGSGNDVMTPFLTAVTKGTTDSVEWCLGDAPLRAYCHFAELHKNDKTVRELVESKRGFRDIVAPWLDQNKELALHYAIFSQGHAIQDNEHVDDGQESVYMQVINFIVSTMPQTLDFRSPGGRWSPLQCAVYMNKPKVVKLLLEHGADWRVRDANQRNLLHIWLSGSSIHVGTPMHTEGLASPLVGQMLEKILLAFDSEDAVRTMLLQRCSVSAKLGSTPLTTYLHNTELVRKVDVLRVLQKFSDGADVAMSDAIGDYPLHIAIKMKVPETVSFLIDADPSILYRENAVGTTPLELARDLWFHESATTPPTMPSIHIDVSEGRLLSRPAAEFLASEPTTPKDERTTTRIIYETCAEAAAKHPGKRRLVSLCEANEVVKRLAGRKTGLQDFMAPDWSLRQKESDVDPVTHWMGGLRTFF